jgi:sugar phosphate isomerase/epimerase
MLYVSTGGLRLKSAQNSAIDFYNLGIPAVELSGGLYSETCVSDILSLPKAISMQVHNYFPPPSVPFVFNLASNDLNIAERSMDHVRSSMRLALVVDRPVYSFHAGFRINPRVAELGQSISRQDLCDRDTALKLFGERVLILAEEARREGVKLLVENNVLNKLNFKIFREDPLLLTHPDEIVKFMSEMPSNVRLLMDVAHLKVSARTLGFDPIEAHDKARPWIQAYHLSDNDGTADTNEIVTDVSWFWDVIKPGLDYYSLEIYRVPNAELASQYNYAKAKLAEKNLYIESKS